MITTAQPVIKLREIHRRYQIGEHEVHALRGVDLDIGYNEYVAIMGPSGSGKSTLMNVVGCLDTPSAGEYWLDGVKVSDMNDDQLAAIRNRRIGFVFQTFNLLPRATALHNVELPLIYSGIRRKERLARAQGVLEQVGLGDRMTHRPAELSGGQRQRVAIARALVTNPAILLADEPTGNLDPDTANDIMNLLDKINARGTAILMATHNYAIIERVRRRIVRIEGGMTTS